MVWSLNEGGSVGLLPNMINEYIKEPDVLNLHANTFMEINCITRTKNISKLTTISWHNV